MENVETRLAECLNVGDYEGAAAIAISNYGPQLLVYLQAVLSDGVLANDAFTQFGAELLLGLPTADRASPFLTHAYRVAWQVAMRVAKDPSPQPGERVVPDRLAEALDGLTEAMASDRVSNIKGYLFEVRRQLSPEDQSLVALRVECELSWSEIAAIMIIDEASLRKRFERTKDRIYELAVIHAATARAQRESWSNKEKK